MVFFLVLVVTSICLAQQSAKSKELSSADTPSQKTEPKTVYILAGRLFDSTSDNVRETMIIVVEGDRIKSVSPATQLRVPPAAKVIDLSHSTVLAGMIDCHTHLDSRADRYNEIYHFKDTPFTHAFFAVGNARRTLESVSPLCETWARNPSSRLIFATRSPRGSPSVPESSRVDLEYPSPAGTVT